MVSAAGNLLAPYINTNKHLKAKWFLQYRPRFYLDELLATENY